MIYSKGSNLFVSIVMSRPGEAAVIIQNGIYSVIFIRTNCISGNIIYVPPKFLMKGFHRGFFNRIHSISVLGKEEKS